MTPSEIAVLTLISVCLGFVMGFLAGWGPRNHDRRDDK